MVSLLSLSGWLKCLHALEQFPNVTLNNVRSVCITNVGMSKQKLFGHLSKYYYVSATDTVGSQPSMARLSRDMACLSLGYEAVECFFQTVSARFDVDYV